MVRVVDILGVVLLLFAGILGCYMARRMQTLGQLYVDCGNMLAAGILFAAGLVHMLPDAVSSWADKHGEDGYPLMFTIAGCSFVFLLFLELLPPVPQSEGLRLPLMDDAPGPMSNDGWVASTSTSTQGGKAREQQQSVTAANLAAGTGHAHGGPQRAWIVYMLFGTLTSHSFLAGLALAYSDESAAWGLLGAILAHKTFAAFSLMHCCIDSPLTIMHQTVICGIFCTATPAGVAVGMITRRFFGAATPLFLAIASGVFLYLGTYHLLGHVDLENSRRLKGVCFALGYGLMALLAEWV